MCLKFCEKIRFLSENKCGIKFCYLFASLKCVLRKFSEFNRLEQNYIDSLIVAKNSNSTRRIRAEDKEKRGEPEISREFQKKRYSLVGRRQFRKNKPRFIIIKLPPPSG